MNFNLENKEDIFIFKILEKSVEGEISAELKTKLLIATKTNIKGLILDLNDVTLMDSSGLGALLLAFRQHKEHNFPLVLVGVQDFLRTLMNITRIDENFVYAVNVDEAIKIVKEAHNI